MNHRILYPMAGLTMLAAAALACALPGPATTTVPTTEAVPTPTATAAGPCTIVASGDVPVYFRPNLASDVFGSMHAGESYPVVSKTADGWYGFEPGVAQAANTGVFRLRWVLEGTSGVTLEGDCGAVPVVEGPEVGVCYFMPIGSTPVYQSADLSSPVVATLELEDYAAVIARAPGWAQVDLSQGNTGLAVVGWVEESGLNLNGPCDSLPEAGGGGAAITATPGPLMARSRSGGLTCRFGPGMEYAPGGALGAEDTAEVVGRNTIGTWLAIALPANPRLRCWLPVESVTLTGDLMAAPILPPPIPYVSRVTVVMDPTEATIPCGTFPYTFGVRFEIEVTGPTTVTFRRSLSDGHVAPTESVTFTSYGMQTFDDYYRVGDAGPKWFQVEVLSPNSVVAQGTATMHCTQ
ncbi:MAG: hypothetical protein AB1449_01460 [Chloroflexota bacterium]